jgi:Mn-dependent DtxR family transcriptional regulator
MEYDEEKADELTLALLYLSLGSDKLGVRAWKSFPWEIMDRLYEKGLIGNRASKAKSVIVTEAGERRAREMFERYLLADS